MTNLRAARDETVFYSQHNQRLPSFPLRLTAVEISQSPTQWVPGPLLYILSPTQWIPGRLLYTLSPTQWVPGLLLYTLSLTQWVPGPLLYTLCPTQWVPGQLLYILSTTQWVQAGCRSYLVSYTVSTRVTLPEGKATQVWIWPLFSI